MRSSAPDAADSMGTATARPGAAAPPLFSICIPVYNRSALIRPAIDSVLAQTVQDFEIVVVDDCSTDDTVDVVRQYTDPRVRLSVNERNQGITKNCRRCFALARGRYTGLLYSDDMYQPQMLERALEGLERPGVGIFSSGAIFILEDGRERNRRHPPHLGVVPARDYFDSLYDLVYCAPPSEAVFRSEFIGRFDGFDPAIKYIPELDFFLKIACAGYAAFHSPEYLCVRRAWAGAATSQARVWLDLGRDEFRILRRYRDHGWAIPPLKRAALEKANDNALQGVNALASAGDRRGAWTQLGIFLSGNVRFSPWLWWWHAAAAVAGHARPLRVAWDALKLRRAQRVAIFGAGEVGRRVLAGLERPERVVAFVDAAPEAQGTEVDGRRVVPPAAAAGLGVDLVVLASITTSQVAYQLQRLGVPDRQLAHVAPWRLLGARFLPTLVERVRLALARRLLIFGCGEGGRRAFAACAGRHEVLAFVDNNPAKQGGTFCDRPILSAADALRQPFDVIIVASMAAPAIWRQLRALGVSRWRILRPPPGPATVA